MKSKRKLALAVIMALIVSMLPMTVFAESAQPEAATFTGTGSTSYGLGMLKIGTDESNPGKVMATAEGGGIYTVECNAYTNAAKVYGMFMGTKADAEAADATQEKTGIFNVENSKIILKGITLGQSFDFAYKTKSGETYKWNQISVTITLGYTAPAPKEDIPDPTVINDSGIINLNPVDGYLYLKFKYAAEGEPVKFSLYSESMARWIGYSITFEKKDSKLQATILRIGNVKEENIGTDYGADKYSVVESKMKNVVMKIKGKYSRAYLGTYDKAIELERTADISGDDVKIEGDKVAIAAAEAEVVALDTTAIGKIKEAEAPVQIQNKAGSVVFDKDAVASIFNRDGLTNVNFEMKDLKSTEKFANSDYDMVLDISLTDAEGRPLFAEGSAKGGATITVPYTNEVPEGKTVKVFYITDSGKEEVEATYDKDAKTVTFKVSHFSQYGIEQADADVTKSPNTGDNTLVLLFVGLMMLSGAAFVATKKGLIK